MATCKNTALLAAVLVAEYVMAAPIVQYAVTADPLNRTTTPVLVGQLASYSTTLAPLLNITTALVVCWGSIGCDHGHCHDFSCICDAGWSGEYCDVPLPPPPTPGQLLGCLGELVPASWSPPRSTRGIFTVNKSPHEIVIEMISCAPNDISPPTCSGSPGSPFSNKHGDLQKPDGGDVPVSKCRIPVGKRLFVQIPTDFRIDAFKMFPKWGCNEQGEACTSHQELSPCGEGQCAAPISTAVEATFNVVDAVSVYQNGTVPANKSGASIGGGKSDTVDVTAVDGITIDFKFQSIGSADCAHDAFCQSDRDCSAPNTQCVMACTEPPCYCDSTSEAQRCPGYQDKTCEDVAECGTNPKRCTCPAAGTCHGALGPLTATVTLEDCPSNIALKGNDHFFPNVDLRVRDDPGNSSRTTGCASPCSWLTKKQLSGTGGDYRPLPLDGSSDIADRYCCRHQYQVSDTCRAASPGNDHSFSDPGKPNEYTEWIHNNVKGVYAWQYDEKTGKPLWKCRWGGEQISTLTSSPPDTAPSYEWTILGLDG